MLMFQILKWGKRGLIAFSSEMEINWKPPGGVCIIKNVGLPFLPNFLFRRWSLLMAGVGAPTGL